MINVSQGINSNNALPLTVTRYSEGAYFEGLWVEGSTSTFKSLVSAQQPESDDLQVLPEGERNKDTVKFYSMLPVRTSNDTLGIQADTVLYNAKTYKIVQVGDWNGFGYTSALGVAQ